MNRHTIETMKRDTYTVPRRRSGAWQWLMAIVMALFAVGAATKASAASPFDARPFDKDAHIKASSGCGALNNIIENGETVTVEFGMTNKTASATTALVAFLQPTANILNPTGSPLVTGSGAGVVAKDAEGKVSLSFTVTGSPGDTITATLNLSDGGTSLGSVSYTFTIGNVVTSSQTFANATPINWAGGATVGNATPFPSSITVPAIAGTVKSIAVTINGLSHAFPEDVQILLATPNGNVLLMRDAGGVSSGALANATLILDDSTGSSVVAVPDETAIPSNATTTYKTQPNGTNGGAGQQDDNNFLSPAPQPPYLASLNDLAGKKVDGTYNLFVNDDSLFGTGQIAGGWSITVTTTETQAGNACNTTPTLAVAGPLTTLEDTVATVGVTVADGNNVTLPKDIQLTVVSSSNEAVIPKANIVVGPATPTDGNRTLTITPAKDAFTTADPVKIKLQAKDGDGLTQTAEFSFTVTSVNDLPSFLTAIGNQSTPIGVPVVVNTTVADGAANETAAKDIQVFVDSSNKTLIPDANIQIPASVDGSRKITISPVEKLEGTSVITLTAVDGNGGTASTSFIVVVGTVTGAPTVSDFTSVAGAGASVTANAITVLEDGVINDVTFTVVDAQSPSDKLKVIVTTDNPGLFVLTSSNTIPVSPVPPATDGKQTMKLTLNKDQFTTATAQVFVTVTDPDGNTSAPKVLKVNVTPINDPPTLRIVDGAGVDVVAPLTVAENTAALVTLLVDDVEQGTNLTITKTSDTPSVIKSEKIGIVSIGAGKYLLTALPEADVSGGPVKITVSVTDGVDTVSKFFTVNVTSVNSAPTFTIATPKIEVDEDSAAFTQAGWATNVTPGSGADEAAQTVSFIVTTDKPSLFAAGPTVTTVPADKKATLTFTPAANANGVATVTVTAVDNGVPAASSAAQQFTISIKAINDRPSFTIPTPVVVVNQDAFNSTEKSVAGFLTAISPGPADEASQTVSFALTVNRPELFSQQPAVDKDGKLTFKTASKQSGNATVTIKATDSAGASTADPQQTFTITVNDVPDAPTITGLISTGYSTSKNTASAPISFTVADPDVVAGSYKDLVVTVTLDPALTALVQPFNSATDIAKSGGTRAFILTPKPGVTSGSGTFTVTVNGLDTAVLPDGNNTTSAPIPFSIKNVNNAPVIILAGETKLDASGVSTTVVTAPKTVKDNTFASFTVDVTDKETASGLIDVTASSDNTAIVPLVLTASDGNRARTLIAQMSGNVAGTNKVKITVSATDNGSAGLDPVTSTAVYELTVEHVNKPATFTGIPSKTSTIEDVPLTIAVDLKDSDATDINKITESSLIWSVVTNTVSSFNSIAAGSAISSESVIEKVVLSGTGNSRTIVVTPKADKSGANEILLNVRDEAGDTNAVPYSVLVTVLATNDAPSITVTSPNFVATSTNAAGNVITGTYTFNEDAAATVALEFNVNDVETAALVKDTSLIPGGLKASKGGLTNLVNGAQITVAVTKNDAGVLKSGVDAPSLDSGDAWIAGKRKINIPINANANDTAGKTVIQVKVTDLGDVQQITGTPNVDLPPITITYNITLVVNPVNDVPVITSIGNVTTLEDTTTPPSSFSVSDVEDGASSLNPVGVSSNEAVVPSKNLTPADPAGTPGIRFGGQAGQRTVSVTPAKDASGSAEITITVTDSQGATATNKFTVTVTAVNDAPSFVTLPATLSIKKNEDSPLINFTIADDGPAGVVVVSATSLNKVLVPDANIFFGGSGANRAMIISPARNQSGDADIVVDLFDGALHTTKTIKLTVIGSNDSPVLGDIANVSVDQNTASKQVPFTVSDTETAAFFLTITGKSSDPSLISNIVINQGGTNRVATLVLEKDKSGVATVTLTADDGNGGVASKSFQVTVVAVNQPPTIAGLADVSIDEDSNTGAVKFSVVDKDSASFTVTASTLNSSVIPDSGIVLAGTGTNWTITATPAANQNGSGRIKITATDAEGLKSEFIWNVNVKVVNDLPSIVLNSNLAAGLSTKEATPVSGNFNVSDVETLPANLKIAATSSDQAIIPNGNIAFTGTGSIRTITVTPAAKAAGSASITITVTDADGGSKTASFNVAVLAINRDDFNADGLSDLVLQSDTGDIAFWFMNGKNQIRGEVLSNPSNPGGTYRVVGTGDFNSDGKTDILFQQQDGGLGIWYMNGSKYVSGAVTSPERPGDSRWHAVATADINRDGQKDILFQHTDGSLAVWYMKDNKLVSGEFLTPNNPGSPLWHLVGAADFNGDGKPDLIFQHAVDRTLAVWYMNGSKFVDSELLNPFDPTAGWEVAAIADFNGDGQADIVFQHDIGSLQVWFMKGPNGVDRQFVNPVNPGAGWSVLAPR